MNAVTSICVNEEQLDRLQVASWILDRPITDLIVEAILLYLGQWHDQIEAVLAVRKQMDLPPPEHKRQGRVTFKPEGPNKVAKIVWKNPRLNVTDEQLDKVHIASWMLSRSVSDIAREAITNFLKQWQGEIDLVVEAKKKAKDAIQLGPRLPGCTSPLIGQVVVGRLENGSDQLH